MDLKSILSSVLFLYLCAPIEGLLLKQVVILSRHNVRTPLSKTLWQLSPKPWPKWKEKCGYLTEKGELLEGFMGEFFSSWLNNEGVLLKGCPTEENLYVYANTAQRTLASAKSFVQHGFPNCSIIIHHANTTDSTFNPYIHNSSATFIQEALNTMTSHMKMLHLNSSYKLLENILDYTKSENCIEHKQCNLITGINKPYVKPGAKPNVAGPLKISKSVIDSFLMENYDGINEVAWGDLRSKDKWETVMKLSKSYHNIIFNSTLIANDLSKPLVKYLAKIFINKTPKVALIMGHDANLYTILNAMGFLPYTLKKQYEVIPIGGKIVFQKWTDNNSVEFLKVDYVYQSTEQMRNGVKLSLDNPPTFQRLELRDCKADNNGFCLWDDFVKLLDRLIL